jgi:hypothetical protein
MDNKDNAGFEMRSISEAKFSGLTEKMENVAMKHTEEDHAIIDQKVAECIKGYFEKFKENDKWNDFINDMIFSQGDEQDRFPLHFVCKKGLCLSTFELLGFTSIDNKVHRHRMMHLENSKGKTALFEVIKHFDYNGASIDSKSQLSNHALPDDYECISRLKIVVAMYSCGAKFSHEDNQEKTVFHRDNLPDDYSLCRRYIIQAITMLVTVHGTQSFQKMMIKSVDESILQFVETFKEDIIQGATKVSENEPDHTSKRLYKKFIWYEGVGKNPYAWRKKNVLAGYGKNVPRQKNSSQKQPVKHELRLYYRAMHSYSSEKSQAPKHWWLEPTGEMEERQNDVKLQSTNHIVKRDDLKKVLKIINEPQKFIDVPDQVKSLTKWCKTYDDLVTKAWKRHPGDAGKYNTYLRKYLLAEFTRIYMKRKVLDLRNTLGPLSKDSQQIKKTDFIELNKEFSKRAEEYSELEGNTPTLGGSLILWVYIHLWKQFWESNLLQTYETDINAVLKTSDSEDSQSEDCLLMFIKESDPFIKHCNAAKIDEESDPFIKHCKDAKIDEEGYYYYYLKKSFQSPCLKRGTCLHVFIKQLFELANNYGPDKNKYKNLLPDIVPSLHRFEQKTKMYKETKSNVRVQNVDSFLSEKNASAAMSGDGDTDEDEEDVMPIQISWMTEQSQGDSKQGKTPKRCEAFLARCLQGQSLTETFSENIKAARTAICGKLIAERQATRNRDVRRAKCLDSLDCFIDEILSPCMDAGGGHDICQCAGKDMTYDTILGYLFPLESMCAKSDLKDKKQKLMRTTKELIEIPKLFPETQGGDEKKAKVREMKSYISTETYKVDIEKKKLAGYWLYGNDILLILNEISVASKCGTKLHPKLLQFIPRLVFEACRIENSRKAEDIVLALMKKGADINRLHHGESALNVASSRHPITDCKVCKVLIEGGASVSVVDLRNIINLAHTHRQYDFIETMTNYFRLVIFHGAANGNLSEDVLAYINLKIDELSGSMYSVSNDSNNLLDYTYLIALQKQLLVKDIVNDSTATVTFLPCVGDNKESESDATLWIKKYMYNRIYKERDENGLMPMHVSKISTNNSVII